MSLEPFRLQRLSAAHLLAGASGSVLEHLWCSKRVFPSLRHEFIWHKLKAGLVMMNQSTVNLKCSSGSTSVAGLKVASVQQV